MVSLNLTILGQSIAFILFVLFCMKYVWPPLIDLIEKRQKAISDSLMSAEHAKKELKIIQTEASDHLKQAKIKARNIIEKANEHSMLIIDQAKVEARIEHDKILTQAKMEVKAERDRVCEELRKQFSILVLMGVEKIIERSVDEVTNRKIVDKIISELTEDKKLNEKSNV